MQLIVTTVMILLIAASAHRRRRHRPGGQAARRRRRRRLSAVTAWDIAKWPVIALVVSLMFSVLYFAAPNVKQPGFKWVTPGGVVALVILLVASALFALYVATSAATTRPTAPLGGVIAFLVWLWVANIAVLLGAELNAELERGRELESGVDADPDMKPELRDDRKIKD